jgi:hypothetical protein
MAGKPIETVSKIVLICGILLKDVFLLSFFFFCSKLNATVSKWLGKYSSYHLALMFVYFMHKSVNSLASTLSRCIAIKCLQQS